MRLLFKAAAGCLLTQALAVILLLGCSVAHADTVTVESTKTDGTLTDAPLYEELAGGNWSFTSGKTTSGGTSSPNARYTPAVAVPGPTHGFIVRPVLGNAGGKYRVQVSHTGTNASPDVIMSVAATGGTGLPATTDAFQVSKSNTWIEIGILQLNVGVTTPEITIQYSSGTLNTTGGRIYSDAIRFVYVLPCEATAAVNVNGPLHPGDTLVRVTGINPAASLVKVYQVGNGTPIGSANPGGQATYDVPTSALVGGTSITATQVVAGQEGCIPASGTLVGDVIIESRTGGKNYNKYHEVSGAWSNSSVKSPAPGTTSGIGSRFASNASGPPAFEVSPNLTANKTYRIETTFTTSASNISEDIAVAVSASNGVLTVDNGALPVGQTGAFQRASGAAGAWKTVGTLAMDSNTTSTVTFTYASGNIAAVGGRFYSDAIRFVDTSDPCQGVNAPPVLLSVTGPLAAGQTTVTVPNVDASAKTVKVFANGFKIGELNSGVVAGSNDVTVSPLVKGQSITATQVNTSDLESCSVPTGCIVGGGANPKIRFALNIKEDATLPGPIGATGSTASATIVFLGSNASVNNGFGNAPSGGKVITPSPAWQTLTFARGVDPIKEWSGPNNGILDGDFGILESLAIALDSGDNGPYSIYIDNLTNGNTMIQDFEGATAGTNTVQFMQPSFASTTSGFLMPLAGPAKPNSSVLSDTYADLGTKSLKVDWQFKDLDPASWVRLMAQGTNGGAHSNPMVDLNKPISLRVLVLPVGVTPGAGPTINTHPQNQSTNVGGSATFTVVASGSGTLHYQWLENGAPVGTDSATLNLTNLSVSDHNSSIVAVVSDNTGSKASNAATLSVVSVPEGLGTIRPKTDGSIVNVEAGQVVALVGSGYFYIQNTDANAGIRVESATTVSVGDTVSIDNAILGTNADGERYLHGGTVNPTAGGGVVKIRTAVNKSVGNAGYVSQGGNNDTMGLTNAGIVMKVVGRVTKWDFTPSNYILIDDGSNVNSTDPKTGVKVYTDYIPQNVDINGDFVDYVEVVGAVGSEIINGKKIRVIRTGDSGGSVTPVYP